MSYVYFAISILLATAMAIFTFQNLQTVTVSFLSVSISLHLSLLIILVYVVGMLTGGSVTAFLKALMKKSRRKLPEQGKADSGSGST